MKRGYKIIVAIVCFICVFFLVSTLGFKPLAVTPSPQIVHAYGGYTPPSTNRAGVNPYNTGTSNIGAPVSRMDAANTASTTPSDSTVCGVVRGSFTKCIIDGIAWLMYGIVYLLSFAVQLGGFLVDKSFEYGVFNMSKNISSITSISVAWKVLRDFANMFFIFGLLYVAIKTILQIGGADVKRVLVNIIIAALLINFSMFITKAIIDASNIVSLGFYNAIAIKESSGTHISPRLMDVLGVQSLFKTDSSATKTVEQWSKSFGTLTYSFGTIIILFIAAFSFMAIAFMMIVRYAVIIMLLVLSPLAFAAYGLPQLKNVSTKWWNALIGQATFPIVYLLIMLVSFMILKDPKSGNTTGAALGQAFGNLEKNPDASDIVVKFSIAIIFMTTALVVAKQYATQAGGAVATAMNWGVNKVDNLRRGTQGVIGRNALRLTGASRLDEKLKNTWVGNTYYGNIVRKATTGAAVSAKFGSGSSIESINKEVETLKKSRAEVTRQKQNLQTIKAGMKAAAGSPEYEEMERTISQMSDKEIENLHKNNVDILTNENVARNLSARHVESIDKSDKFTEAQKDQIKGARFRQLNTSLQTPGAPATRGLVRGLSDREIELLDPATVTNPDFVANLLPFQYDAMVKSNKFTRSQKQRIRELRTAPLLAAIAAAAGQPLGSPLNRAVGTQLSRLGTAEIPRLDRATLTTPVVMDNLNPKMLERIANETNDQPLLHEIGNHIRAAGAAHASHNYVTAGLGRDIFV